MTTSNGAPRASNFELPYITCRNISGPEDEAAGRKIYAGHAPTSSVLPLEDDENVREYLVDALGKAKARPTLVHQAIRKTLADHPDQFSILNGGIVIVARAAEVDDKRKILILKHPSIINGSQTQGELVRYFENRREGGDFYEPSIKYELIVTSDEDLIAEISISRNFQNDVRAISIAGRRGQLDEFEEAVQRVIPGAKLRKSETDLAVDDEFLDTEKLIQVLFALMPQKLFAHLEKDATSKVFAYSQKTRCLKLFQRVLEGRQGDIVRDIEGESPNDAIYAYFLDMAGPAWKLYQKWKSHTGFQGTRLRSIEREKGEIANVPDGIVFPILSALSEFVVSRSNWRKGAKKRWVLRPVERFDEQELIDAAKQVYTEIADHNPQTMGKSKACYSALQRITAIYARLAMTDVAFNPIFLKKVSELELSVRSENCLKNSDVVYIGDLVQKSEAEMLRSPFFGRKSLYEIKEVLSQMGLHLGMEVPGWPPDNIDELAKALQIA